MIYHTKTKAMRKEAYLKEDVVAYNFQVRGKKGDLVYLRFKHDNVYIVENEKGIKFSVHKDKIDAISKGVSGDETKDSNMDKSKSKNAS